MSVPQYKDYKDSGVKWLGKIPSGWGVRRIRHLFEIRKRISGAEGHEVLSITQQGIKPKDIESGDGQLSADYSKYQFVEVGDFAMNHMDLLTGYVDISPMFGVTSPDYRVFAVRDKEVCFDKYYLYLFQAGYRNKVFYAFGQGSSQFGRWRFPTDEFNSFEFPFPPMEEQKRIATFLDHETAKIDELVAEQERLIGLLKEKRQAVVSLAVTKGLNPDVSMRDSGFEWLGAVPRNWEVAPLKRRCSLLKDGTHLPPSRVDEGIPLLSVRNIENGKFSLRSDDSLISVESYQELCKSFVPLAGDVVLAIVGATLGKTAIIPSGLGNFFIQRSVAIFRPSDGLQARWLHFVFQSQGFQRLLWQYVGYSAQPGIYLGTLGEFRVPVPSLSEQSAIVAFLDQQTTKLDTLVAEAQTAISLLDERRMALISAAVTGKIDVRGFVGVQPEEVAAE